MIDTVIFDMDGLLIHSEPLWVAAMQEVFQELGANLTLQMATRTTGLRTIEVVEYWQRYFQWKQGSAQSIADTIVERVREKVLSSAITMQGTGAILEYFKSKGIKTGLASSSPMALIQPVLKHFQLRSYFNVVYSAEREAYGKPHPAVYLSCAAELGTAPHSCLAFEDSVTGMIAAKAARMKVVVVPEAHNRTNPKYVLADLQLPSLSDFNEDHWKHLSSM